jgi:tetratricopeptide (TPR) repeat protein
MSVTNKSLNEYIALFIKQLSKGMCGLESEFEIFNMAIKQYPSSGKAYFYRGQAYSYGLIGEYQLAENDYNQAFNLGFQSDKLYESRAFARTQLKKFNLACDDYTILIKEFPNSGKYYHWRGLRRLDNKEEKLAEADFLKSIEVYRDYSYGIVYQDLSRLYRARKEYNKAMQIISNGLRVFTGDIALTHEAAEVNMALGNFKLAFEGYKYCLEKDCEHPDYYKSMGTAKFKLREFQSAVQYYTNAINLDDMDFEGYLLRSKTWYELMERRRAFEDCEKAKFIDPKYKEASDYYGYLVLTLSPN